MNWDTLVESLGPRLYNYFARRGFLKDAADHTQEVFARLYVKVQDGSFDANKGSVDAFTFGIARFVALENNQSSQIYQLSNDSFNWDEVLSTENHIDMDAELHRRQTLELFLEEIKSLNLVQQEVLALYMDDDLKLDDIAEMMKLPVGTVKSHLFRAKEKLKNLLDTKGIYL